MVEARSAWTVDEGRVVHDFGVFGKHWDIPFGFDEL